MNILRRLAVITAFTLFLSPAVMGGEMQSPPCATAGSAETTLPPCPSVQLVPAEDGTAVASPASTEYVLTEATIDFIQSVLSLL